MRSFFSIPKKISWRLTIIYALMFTIVLLLLNITVYLGFSYFIKNNARNNIDNVLEYVLPKIRGVNEYSFDVYDADFLQEVSKSGQIIYFRILNSNKEIVAQSYILKNIDIPIKKGFNEIKHENEHFIYKSILILKDAYLDGYFIVVRDVTLEYRFLSILFLILSTACLIGGIVAIFTGYVLTKKNLDPINKITNTVRSISVFDLDKRLEINGPEDELTRLSETFNSMLDRLEDSFKRQQEFVSDASHELRTPISVIQGYVDLLSRWGKEDEEISNESIEAIQNEVRNMKDLVNNLLFLARGDSDKIKLNKEEFWVDELVEELINETRMLENELNIYSKINERNKFYGNRKLIKQMLRIFIDNSLKFTSSGGEIVINSKNRDKFIEFIISDTGIGIPKEEQKNVFKRFYKADILHSSPKEGAGLGLAIARWIIDAHEGKIKLKSRPGHGTVIKVFLPKKN
jgi:two-component system, OmpR family, sensor histidine kinase ArlS